MSKKTIEITLYRNLFCYFNKDYVALVSIINTVWKNKTINLVNNNFWVIRYIKINKRNNKDNTDIKVLTANIY